MKKLHQNNHCLGRIKILITTTILLCSAPSNLFPLPRRYFGLAPSICHTKGAAGYAPPLLVSKAGFLTGYSHCKQQHKNMQSEGLRLFVENKNKINMTLCLISCLKITFL